MELQPAITITGRSDMAVEMGLHHVGLVRAIATLQDRAAFTELFNTFAPKLKGYMMRGGSSAELAEDLAIETFVKLWTKAHTFDPLRSSVTGWIYTIARNHRIDVLRRERHPDDVASGMESPVASASPEDDFLCAERATRVRSAMNGLPPEQIEILTLSFMDHRPHEDIARSLNLPLGTVKSRIRLALKRLRTVLGDA